MRLQVWHNKNFLDFEKHKYGDVDTVYLPEDNFGAVAFLEEANSLEDGFFYTQNIDEPWAENPQVIPLSSVERYRSTSVGDVIKNMETGEYFIVMPTGFKKFVFLESEEQVYQLLRNANINPENFKSLVEYLGEKISRRD